VRDGTEFGSISSSPTIPPPLDMSANLPDLRSRSNSLASPLSSKSNSRSASVDFGDKEPELVNLDSKLVTKLEQLEEEPKLERSEEKNGKSEGSGAKSCGRCGTDFGKLKTCGGCQKVYYCGKVCQSEDWEIHQRICQKTIK